MAKQTTGAQQVRIIGGKWKGRKLRFNGDASLRPTQGRMRETLFNWLRPEIAGMRCLDAFAGSGVLGFEALSQGAAQAVLVEQHARTVQSLRTSVADLNAEQQATVVQADALKYLQKPAEPFDLVFLDPPFARPELLNGALHLLMDTGLLRGYVYAESAEAASLEQLAEQNGLILTRQTRSGDSSAVLLTI